MNATPGTLQDHDKEWLRPQEAAELIRLSLQSFYAFLERARKAGFQIKPRKSGLSRSASALYSRAEIESALDAMGGREKSF